MYFGSVAIRSVPLSHTCASASPADVSAVAHTPSAPGPVDPVSPLAVLLLLSSLQAAATSVRLATSTKSDRNVILRMLPPSGGERGRPSRRGDYRRVGTAGQRNRR